MGFRKSNSAKGVIRFYIIATKKGQYDINAYLDFDNNGNEVFQPIGTASFEALANKITLPKRTCRKKIGITGVALPDSEVTLYDNDKCVGTTMSNKNGTWSMEIELDKTYSYSYHKIYATLKKDNYDLVFTDKELLIYDEKHVDVSKVTMINQAHPPETTSILEEYSTEIDFLNPKPVKPYRYWPDYPKFTFKVEFTNGGDDKALSGVSVVVNGINNEVSSIPLTYDAVSGCWLGSANFSAYNAPQAIGVDFILNEDSENELFVDADMLENMVAVVPEISQSDAEILQSYLNVEVVENNIDTCGNGTAKLSLSSDDDAAVLTYSSQKIDNFINDGSFEKINLSDGTEYYFKYEITEDYTIETMYDSDSKTLISIKCDSAVSLAEEEIEVFGAYSDFSNLMEMIQYATRWFSGSLEEVAENTENLWNEFQEAKAQNPCFYNSPSAEFIEKTAQREYSQIKESIASTYGQVLSMINSVGGISNLLPSEVASFIKSITGRIQLLLTGELASLHCKMFNLAYMAERAQNAGKPCIPPSGGGVPSPNFPLSIIQDPSGYVYEAVPSNRIEGVKAECYYYDYALDEFGIAEEEKSDIFWIAEEYDQLNPLFTDKNGMYQWDVPPGEWLVKFSKDGYYDTDSKSDIAANDSGYLPVPPPQTEVNTAIVSKAAPEVKNINVYNNEVQIIFTQYMQPDSVNTDNVKIISNGKEVSGVILPVNAEYDYKQENQYASIFRFIPDEPLTASAEVEINNVINYAGRTIAGKTKNLQAVDVKPEEISISSSVEVPYNSGSLLEIAILPEEAGANKKLIITTLSPSIVGVVNNEVTTDENGKATVMLNGNLPGEGGISIAMDGTDITAKATAVVGDVVSNSNNCAKVTSNIETGSTVEAGIKVELSTTTEGAEIYYTLDGTCPCIVESSSRIRYTGPITVDRDMFIIAYAVKEGMDDGPTAGFVYNVNKADSYKIGDIYEDGLVNSKDSIMLSQYLAKWKLNLSESQKKAADIYKDNLINSKDAVKLAQYLAKWNITLD